MPHAYYKCNTCNKEMNVIVGVAPEPPDYKCSACYGKEAYEKKIRDGIDPTEAHRLDSALTDVEYIRENIKKYEKGEISRIIMVNKCRNAISSLQELFDEYDLREVAKQALEAFRW